MKNSELFVNELYSRIENCEKCIKSYENRIRTISHNDKTYESMKEIMELAEKIESNEDIIDRFMVAIEIIGEINE